MTSLVYNLLTINLSFRVDKIKISIIKKYEISKKRLIKQLNTCYNVNHMLFRFCSLHVI